MFVKGAIRLSFLTVIVMISAAGAALSQGSGSTSAATTAAEDVNITSAAKTFYNELLTGNVDRSKMTAAVNTALTDSLVKTLAQQLGALGTPKWQYLKQTKSENGNVQVYKLSYNSATLYLTFGISPGGTIFSLFFGSQEPTY